MLVLVLKPNFRHFQVTRVSGEIIFYTKLSGYGFYRASSIILIRAELN